MAVKLHTYARSSTSSNLKLQVIVGVDVGACSCAAACVAEPAGAVSMAQAYGLLLQSPAQILHVASAT